VLRFLIPRQVKYSRHTGEDITGRGKGRSPFNRVSRGLSPCVSRDGRGGGEERHAQARRDDHRADERQHRRGPRARERGEGISPHPHHARDDVDRAPQARGRIRCGNRPDARRGRHEGRDRQGERTSRRDARRGDPPAVREPREPRLPLPHHRSRGLGGHKRRSCRVRRRRRHGRHDHRHGQVPQGEEPGREALRRRARHVASPLRRTARPPQDPGHRRGIRPEGAGHVAADRGRQGICRERGRHGACGCGE